MPRISTALARAKAVPAQAQNYLKKISRQGSQEEEG
jgi:hypothetical protein